MIDETTLSQYSSKKNASIDLQPIIKIVINNITRDQMSYHCGRILCYSKMPQGITSITLQRNTMLPITLNSDYIVSIERLEND
jgi:hypothetical protein